MRLILDPVEFEPGAVRVRGQRHRVVRVLDRWRYGGRWWRGEPPRDYLLLEVEGGGVLEVFREGNRWFASRWLD